MSQDNTRPDGTREVLLDDILLSLTREELAEADRELSDEYQFEAAAAFQAKQAVAEAEREAEHSQSTDELMKDEDDPDASV